VNAWLLRQYETEICGFLKQIVTGDGSWVRCYHPEVKRASEECRHSCSPECKVFHPQAFERKVMLMICCDHQGPLVKHYKSPVPYIATSLVII
jgi:hypothetical protein